MARKTNTTINGKEYYRITKTIGHRLNEDGKKVPVRKQFLGKSKKDAEAKYDKYMEQQKRWGDSGDQAFGILLEDWINDFFIPDKRLSHGTKSNYISAWKRLLKDDEVSCLPISQIEAKTIQQLYNKADCSPATIRSLNNLLRRFYKYLRSENKGFDFTDSLIIPDDESRQREKEQDIVVWSDEEIQTIISGFDNADPRFRFQFLIILLYNTGMRISEARGLKYSDFDLEKKTLNIKRQVLDNNELTTKKSESARTDDMPFQIAPLKTESSYRSIPLNDAVIQELERHRKWHIKDQIKNGYRTDFLFTTASGKFYDRHNIRRGLERYYKAIDLPPYKTSKSGAPIYKSVHAYRHTFATNLMRYGTPLEVTSSLLGHESVNITAKYYINVGTDRKREAVEMLMCAF